MGKRPVRKGLALLAGLSLYTGSAFAAPAPDNSPPPTAQQTAEDRELRRLSEELEKLTAQAAQARTPAETVANGLRQAEVIIQISNRSRPEERGPWLRQLADCLQVTAMNSPAGDQRALRQLTELQQVVSRTLPGSALAAYVSYREVQAGYANLAGGSEAEVNRAQEQWYDRLAGFVQAYPRADETPNALLELGMVCELRGKDAEAARWYGQLAEQFKGTPLAARAEGAVRRLDLEGKEFRLALPTLEDSNRAFDVDELRGKAVVVYFWASWDKRCAEDFVKLQQLVGRFGAGRLGLLCVNLDAKPEEARAFVQNVGAPGVHVYQAGGLDGKVARRYGLITLPSLVVVDKDGKVASRKAEVGSLEYKLEQMLKPARAAE